jgi:iron complex transport system substrate-binding protein
LGIGVTKGFAIAKGYQVTIAIVVWALLYLNPNHAFSQSPIPQRVISLNMCTDQLLLDLAPAGQIIGLSPFAKDSVRSWSAEKVQALPILSGSAEEILVLKPDLVVAGRFTRRATREFIRARGIPLEEFDPVRSINETKQQIIRFGEITGATEKAAQRVTEINNAVAQLRAVASAKRIIVLPLSRRGWVAGTQSLMSDILAQAGLSNAATELGFRVGGVVSLEAIVKVRPDAILITRNDGSAEDQGRAMLLHPALHELFPPERRIVIPEKLTVCGGPMLTEALRTLAEQIVGLKPRDVAAR